MKPFTIWPTFDRDLRGRFKLRLLFLLVTQGYEEEKMQGQCCGRCLPMACTIQLRGGQIMMLKVCVGNLNSGVSLRPPSGFLFGDIFFKEEGLSLGQY